MNNLETRLENTETSTVSIQNNITDLQTSSTTTQNNITDLDRRVTDNETNTTTIQNDINDLDIRVTNTETSLNNISDLDTRLAALGNISELESKMSSLIDSPESLFITKNLDVQGDTISRHYKIKKFKNSSTGYRKVYLLAPVMDGSIISGYIDGTGGNKHRSHTFHAGISINQNKESGGHDP